MMAATRHEYKGTGKTVQDKKDANANAWVFWVIIAIFILISVLGKRNGTGYSRAGSFGTGFFLGGGGGGFSGGGGGGGGFERIFRRWRQFRGRWRRGSW